ncbi:MAG: GNAT family N-acetyltransferase [Actinobacteria bacterium]|nr:GNAT family N-acetyltransferase [Actinomycetota bacterium]
MGCILPGRRETSSPLGTRRLTERCRSPWLRYREREGDGVCLDQDVESVESPWFQVRAATAEDIPTLLDLWESVAAEGRWIGTEVPIAREARASRWKTTYFDSDAGCMFVAATTKGIVASAGVQNDRGLVDLGMLVERRHRREGIGSQLLQACIDWAERARAHKMILQVWPHNEAAIRLYEKFGFEREGYRRAHYRRKTGELWDVVEMGLVLGDVARENG